MQWADEWDRSATSKSWLTFRCGALLRAAWFCREITLWHQTILGIRRKKSPVHVWFELVILFSHTYSLHIFQQSYTPNSITKVDNNKNLCLKIPYKNSQRLTIYYKYKMCIESKFLLLCVQKKVCILIIMIVAYSPIFIHLLITLILQNSTTSHGTAFPDIIECVQMYLINVALVVFFNNN